MLKLSTSRTLIAASVVALLVGCANNPYDGQQGQQGGSNKAAIYGGLGALGGAAIGAATSSKKDRGKGALIGAAVAGAAGAGYGYYADKQEAELRRSMQGTGIDVQRDGDNLTLVMPGNVTFATDSSTISGNFYGTLNSLVQSFNQYDQNTIEIIGHTDSTGPYQHNMNLSQRRAQSVADYLRNQGVSGMRMSVRGVGPDQPIADNGSAQGRQQNRRVEINLRPIPGAYQ
ncbi:MAG TPA: OmpA family protein [Gammaproteobacteria bacterium]|nr:OmpA family protein [Gammaproteobacteria bacterium]